jgi:biopolymer transport protein ExbD
MEIDLGEDEGLEIQMAPLIDCVFLLLIFFLVATTLKKIDEELPLTLPDSAASMEVKQPDSVTVLSIDFEQNLYLDGTPISTAMLHTSLRNLAAENPEQKIRLDIDRDVPFQRVMEVLDLLRFENLQNVGVNTKRRDKNP